MNSSFDVCHPIEPDAELQRLFNLSFITHLNEKAVVKVIQRKPSAAMAKYTGVAVAQQQTPQPILRSHPLYLVLHHGTASFETVHVIYRAYPQAARCKYNRGRTLLHEASRQQMSTAECVSIFSLLLKAWPEALEEEDDDGLTPIFLALQHDAPLEVVSLLLEACPSSIQKKDKHGRTCLHYACSNYLSSSKGEVAAQVVSLLLQKWPHAVKVKEDIYGMIPLHYACFFDASLNVIQLLLEGWPSSVNETDHRWGESLMGRYYGTNENVKMCLAHVASLVETALDHPTKALKIMNDFIRIRWVGGIALVFDSHPSLLRSLGQSIPFNASSSLLHVIGSKCKLMTMFGELRNRPELYLG